MISAENLAAGFSAGVCGGVLTVTFVVHFFWSKLMANRGDWEETKADVKELRSDLNRECAKRQRVEDRVHALEHPPFEPNFGDMVMAERVDKSGMWPAVYLFTREKLHRVVACKVGDEVVEYFTDRIEPLE